LLIIALCAFVAPRASIGQTAPPPLPPAEAAPAPKSPAGATIDAAPPPPNEAVQPTAEPVSGIPQRPAVAPQPHHSETDVSVDEADSESASAGWPSLGSVFGAPFMQLALLAGLIVAGVCAYVGVYVVLKRIVFVGVALAEVSSAGVALALLIGFSPFLGAVVLMLVGIGLFSVRWAPRIVSQESFIGIGWAVASAFGVLLMAKSAQGEAHMHDLLFGNILTVDQASAMGTAAGLALVLLVHALFAKEFLFVSFDADTANAMGYRARSWDLLLYATIGFAIAFSIHTVGVLLAFSALVLPPVTALLLVRRMKSAFVASVALALIPVPIGLYLSFARDLPSSAAIVAVMFVILLLSGTASHFRREGA
jgi:ABC-type Mn2+/Zn2+ transport system permease subunit